MVSSESDLFLVVLSGLGSDQLDRYSKFSCGLNLMKTFINS